jgi:hypothetical protein
VKGYVFYEEVGKYSTGGRGEQEGISCVIYTGYYSKNVRWSNVQLLKLLVHRGYYNNSCL